FACPDGTDGPANQCPARALPRDTTIPSAETETAAISSAERLETAHKRAQRRKSSKRSKQTACSPRGSTPTSPISILAGLISQVWFHPIRQVKGRRSLEIPSLSAHRPDQLCTQ